MDEVCGVSLADWYLGGSLCRRLAYWEFRINIHIRCLFEFLRISPSPSLRMMLTATFSEIEN